MPAACAVCEGPISKKGEAFVLVGTEVLHRRCLDGAGATKLQNTQRALAMSQQSANQQRRLVLDATRAIDRVKPIIEAKDKLIARLQNELAASRESTRASERVELERARTQLEYRRQRDEARRERDEVRGQLEAARREAALHQTIQGAGAVTTASSSQQVEPAKDDRDPTEVRFSLLEIDAP